MPIPGLAGVSAYALSAQLWVLFVRLIAAVVLPLSVVVFIDHARHITACAWLRHQRWRGRPGRINPRKELPDLLASGGCSKGFPMVGVQLPIFNERAVCQLLVDYACRLQWPADRLRIQVLDDSTDVRTRQLVDDKVAEWRSEGSLVEVLRRTNRQGYKAGALKAGMQVLSDCAYVAVFDADFRPEPGFLLATVPYLEGDAGVAYVQARWAFANAGESWLTQAQELSLNHHFRCEQYVHHGEGSFFNFNGTAGVWRTAAVADAGGWSSRTTVEDMDLSLRTYLAGWRAVYLDDVACVSELPSSLFAFRKQQHRWTTGPVQLALKIMPDIARSRLPLHRKAELLLSFFGVRKLATHFLCLVFYCTLLPISVFTPQIEIPTWALLHVPLAVTLSTCMFTRRGWTFAVTYVLFQNAMALVKAWAVVAGLLGLKHANEWVVTTKLGREDQTSAAAAGGGSAGAANGKGQQRQGGVQQGGGQQRQGGDQQQQQVAVVEVPGCRVYPAELAMAAFMLLAALWGIVRGAHFGVTCFLLLQGVTFASFGMNMVDCRRGPAFKWDTQKPLGSMRRLLFGCLP